MRGFFPTAVLVAALAYSAPAWAQDTFDSPDAAMASLLDAAVHHNLDKLATIFGPQAHAVLSSGNLAQDKAEQSEFVRLYRAKHELKPSSRNPNRVIVYIGNEDWPFPVPIVKVNGKWIFDVGDAQVEMRARRIGTDELDAIEICTGYVEAQKQYAGEMRNNSGTRMYASHMISTPGKQDGLYWPSEAGPLVPLAFAQAVWSRSNPHPKPYHGYYFRILDGQGPSATGGAHNYVVKNKLIGGFGLVAWPAKYEVTGIRTFIVNQDGRVYEKDIPPAPNGGPSPVTRYDPDSSWTQAQ